MARRIVGGGYDVTLWARRAAILTPFADTSAKTAQSPAELAAASELVCLCVVGDDDVREVLAGDNGVLAGLAPGGIVAIHSTVHPDTCRELAESAAKQGVSIIDAPVSGGGPAAEEGQLLVMVGGDDEGETLEGGAGFGRTAGGGSGRHRGIVARGAGRAVGRVRGRRDGTSG